MRTHAAALLFATLVIGIAAIAILPPRPVAAVPSAASLGRESTCVGEITGTVSVGAARVCDQPSVTTLVEPLCPVCPGGLNVVFVELSEAPQHSWQNQEAVRVLDEIQRYTDQAKPETLNIAVIHYDGADAVVRQRFTDDFDRARSALRRPRNGYIPRGDAEKAARLAVQELAKVRRESPGEDPCEVVVMFAHVKEHDSWAANLERAGQIIKRQNVLFVVGCPIESGAWYCEGPEPDMPKSRRYYAKYPESGKLSQVVRREMQNFPGDVGLRELTLVQTVPPGLAVIASTLSVTPTEVLTLTEGTRLTWTWTGVAATGPHSVTYRVQPERTGQFPITSTMKLVDTIWAEREIPLEAPPVVAVLEECPVPPTPTPTATSTATATRTATPPPTPTDTPTPTPSFYQIYLPMAYRESCIDRRRHADVVLVLDASTSMRRLTRDGRPKIEAVQDAARAFVAQMRFTPDEHGDFDQVAVVGFNRDAWIEQPLTNDPLALAAAIDALPAKMREYTRLDLALERGAEALADPRVRADSARILVLLTDGLPNQVPYDADGTMETTVLKAAAAAKAAGVRLYTVGVGRTEGGELVDRINVALLEAAASAPSMFYQTIDAEDLAAIYEDIAIKLGCVALPALP